MTYAYSSLDQTGKLQIVRRTTYSCTHKFPGVVHVYIHVYVYSCNIFYAARKINVAKFHNKKSRVMVVTDVAVSDGVCV